MHETVASMNGTIWIFAAILIAMVCIQAVLFLRLALNFNKKNKLVTQGEIKSAMRTGTISVIGPAISVIVVAMALISYIGPAATYMRTGVIGAATFELMMANQAITVAGAEFGTDSFTPAVFTLCLFAMVLASAGYIVNTILTLKPLDMAIAKSQQKKDKSEKANISFLPYLGKSAFMGSIGMLLLNNIRSSAHAVAALTAAVVSYMIMNYVKKQAKKA